MTGKAGNNLNHSGHSRAPYFPAYYYFYYFTAACPPVWEG